MINVVNKRYHKSTPLDVPIHRGFALGNPWTHIKGETKALYQCETREESIEKYKVWFDEQIASKNQEVLDVLRKIYKMAKVGDVNLVCYCFPLKCHGQIIKNYVESYLKD